MGSNGTPGSGALRVVGTPRAKVDAVAKVTGATRFADDLALPQMLHAKLLRSHLPHARIVSIDTARARALPGVHAVLVGADLPTPYGILPVSQDEHALCLDRVRFIGDPVAAVAAVDEETALAACELIAVVYQPLEPVSSLTDALRGTQPQIHLYGDGHNIHKVVALEFGDVDAALGAADWVQEDVFFYEGNTHLPMEQHAALAQATADGRLTLWTSSQTPHYVHRALATVLGLRASRIRVIATPNGGGFGGKSDPFGHEIVVAELSRRTARPVKICLTREEVFYCHRGRHPVLMELRT
ncbi:MAG: xanthine dehydrogenase family protein molybdopterin-binding subunit, partial [Gemmatimonadota bacterium]